MEGSSKKKGSIRHYMKVHKHLIVFDDFLNSVFYEIVHQLLFCVPLFVLPFFHR